MFCAYISTYVAQCPISFGSHILDMMVPFQTMADFQPKVFCMVYCLYKLTMFNILGLDGVLGPGDMHDLAFAGIEVYFPSFFPM